MREEALLLTSDDSCCGEEKKIAKILDFFGIGVRTRAGEQLHHNFTVDGAASKVRLFCSSDVFLRLIEDLERSSGGIRRWQEQVHSAFIYAGDNFDALEKLARKLTRDNEAGLQEMAHGSEDVRISGEVTGFCAAMAGVNVARSKANLDRGFLLNASNGAAINIISTSQGTLFSKLEYQKIAVFLSVTKDIIELDATIGTGVFDIRDHVLSAVPIVSYIRWAFAGCWHSPEINACLIVDDPLLKSSYGFLNFKELLRLMMTHGFSTNVAFIPWNWWRSSTEVATLFREHPGVYSISVHGCDHTHAEFGSADRQHLYRKAKQALARMNLHECRTKVHYDPVMVFPQGVFSEAAMSVLRHTDLIAAVNNDTISADLPPHAITIADVWNIAVMGYCDFPLFTRRYPAAGVANFAFDALLGKPAIVVIHHDFCDDRCARLIDFVDRLNGLKCPLTWRSLGEVVSQSYRQRELLTGVVEVEMYGTELRIKNFSGQPKRFAVKRHEHDPSEIKFIQAGPQQVDWNFAGNYINFEINLKSHESATVRIKFHDISLWGGGKDSLRYKVKTMMRRYLSEARDNYAMRCAPSLANRLFKIN